MKQQTKIYIKNWTKRILSYKGEEIDTLMDKFSSQYILYNRLFNESFQQLKEAKQLTKTRYSDREKAINLVVDFNSATDIIQRLELHQRQVDIEILCNLIANDIFHINLLDGVSQKDLDLELMNNLANQNPEIKAQAVLSIIYNVRCNIQHAEKHNEPEQIVLLRPLINILEVILQLQIEKLSNIQ